MPTRSTRTLGTGIFLLGLLFGLGLALVSVWGDYEAASYYNTGAGYEEFGALSCPILMSRSEVATVSARFDNPTDQEIEPYYEIEISATASTRNLEQQITVPAHASRTVRWTVSANDLNLESFVLVKMDVLPVAGFSTREATCGIVMVNLAGPSGGQIFGLWLGISLLGMGAGFGLREGGKEPITGRALNVENGLRAAGIAALLAMLTGLMGWWLVGLIFEVITILLLVILLRFLAL